MVEVIEDNARRKRLYDAAIRSGLFPIEARKLCYAKTNQYDSSLQSVDNIIKSGLYTKILRSRVRTIRNLRVKGWSDDSIRLALRGLIKQLNKNGDSVWQFIRSEYNITQKGNINYKDAIHARSMQSNRVISKTFKDITGISYKSHLPINKLRGTPVSNKVNLENRLI
jgi:hypothetical protein